MSETWLDEHKDAEIDIGGYQLYRSDCSIKRTRNRGRERGGVALYLREDLVPLSEILIKFSNGAVEILALYIKKINTVVIVVYRHPDDPKGRVRSTMKEFKHALEEMSRCLSSLQTPYPEIIMCGDFNLPHADWTNGSVLPGASSDERSMIEKLFEFCEEHFLFQLIAGPTQRSGNTLDLCLSNNPALLHFYKCITTIYSDHKIIECATKSKTEEPEPTTLRSPKEEDGPLAEFDSLNFLSDDANWEEMINDLSSVRWREELESLTPSEMFTRITEICLEVSRKHVPIRTSLTRKRSRIPRTRRILMRRRTKVNTQLQYARNEDRKIKLEDEAREIEKKLQASYKEEDSNSEAKTVSAIRKNPKYFFAYAKKFSTLSTFIGPLLNSADLLISSASEMAEILSRQYTSVFSTPKSPLKDPSEYFPHSNSQNNVPILENIEFSREDIKKAMREIPTTAAAGPDRVPAILLKLCCEPLSEPLYIMWRISMNQGKIPQILKTANIVPIYKGKGADRSRAKSYRPVALTSHITKIFEKVIRRYIIQYMEHHKLFNPSQHGFRAGRSCLSQLLAHYEKILQLMEEGFDVDVIYLDFAKAFDKVDFTVILQKLKDMGVQGHVGRWIHQFITGRTQSVLVNGCRSKPAKVSSGVPQGSVLGPLLFLVLIGDIDQNIASVFLSSFADDTRMGHGIRTMQDTEALQEDLNSVYKWTDDNNMELHGDKFEHLHYRCGRSASPASQYISSDGSIIETESEVDKDLGVMMSSDGTFKLHISGVVKEARSQAAWVLRTFVTRERLPMLTLFKSLVQCKLDYCSQLWSPTSKGEITALEMVQRSFIRKIQGISSMPYWDQLKMLKLYSQERRRERYMIIYIWRILEGQVPNICDKVKLKSHRYGTEETRLGRLCEIPPLNRSCVNHVQNLREASMPVRGQKLFNSLPKYLREMTGCSKDAFKAALDKYLSTIPDEPQIQGYTSMRRAESNSLLDMRRHAYSEANRARVEGASEAREGCVADVAMD